VSVCLCVYVTVLLCNVYLSVCVCLSVSACLCVYSVSACLGVCDGAFMLYIRG